jgi:hypothetical protein
MSAYRKDARWELATSMVEEAELLGLADVAYPVGQRILDAAEALLSEIDDEALVARLADKWNSRS